MTAPRAPADWPVAPLDLRLPEHAVDVWRADLDAAGDAVAALLSSDERARAARFAREQDGRRWARARGILRALLGRYLDADARGLRFVLGAHGKPALAPAGGSGDLRFNLSHSAGVALYAFARGREVGIDVELPRRAVDAVAIARRAFGEQEAQRLSALDPPQRERELLRLWARHEAQLKCRGTGIGGTITAEGSPLWVVELDAGAPGAAALAVEGAAAPELRCWTWRG